MSHSDKHKKRELRCVRQNNRYIRVAYTLLVKQYDRNEKLKKVDTKEMAKKRYGTYHTQTASLATAEFHKNISIKKTVKPVFVSLRKYKHNKQRKNNNNKNVIVI